LQAAGIPLALSAQGLDEPDEFWKSVRHAIDAGLSAEAALAALTRDAARILGQDRRLGTLEPGKLANLVVWTGPLEDKRSRLRQVFIEGQRFDLDLNAKPVPPPAPPAQPNAPLAGAWNLEIDAGEAKLSATVDLQQKDDKLSGSFRSPQGDGKLTRGQVKGADFEFDVAIGAGAQAIELKFKGAVDPQDANLAKGTLKSAFGGATPFTARRPTADAKPKEGEAPAGQLTLDFILDERARELFWEGHRRQDLIRFGKYTGASKVWPWKGNTAAGTGTPDFRKLYPLPASELIANKNLTQNTGY
ncbi:MAG: RagB/SusD family nutrient uptake outer membrane protein, partial [Planctomycetaceae bacterium]